MNKIKEIIIKTTTKFKNFSIFRFVLNRRIMSLTNDFDLNSGIITIYKERICNWTDEIDTTKGLISILEEVNKLIKKKT